jgi:hypothetical protein
MIPVGILTATTTAFSFLLDIYPGATAAYSLRKLRSGYSGSCIQVRRSSDNATQNIGFVNNYLDTTSILTFCGANSGYVSIWYDQSGNANNLNQTVLANQPQIVSTGSLITINGKNAIIGIFPSSFWNLTSAILTNTNYSQFFVTNTTAITGNSISFASSANYFSISGMAYNGTTTFYFSNRSKYGTFIYTQGNCLFSLFSISSNLSAWQNNVSKTITNTTSASTANFDYFGRTQSDYGRSYWIEDIFYSDDQTGNRTGIQTNINTYYTIY